MKAGSLFAGIRGFDEALRRCGIPTAWAAEQDAKCNSVGRRHFPDEETIECVTAVSGPRFGVDIITAGWPCQGNSVAGRRAGMADERSGLWSEVKRVLAEQHPQWFLGENVPGILSVNGGRDWLAVLRDLAELGYGTAYRVFDAQWFGVPQRRRRVFVVGYLGDWRRAAKVLFEPKGLPWDSPPSREAGEGVAGTTGPVTSCGGTERKHGHGWGQQEWESGFAAARTLRAEGFDASEDGTGRGTPIIPIDMRQASRGEKMTNERPGGSSGGPPGTGIGNPGDPSPTLADSHTPAIAYQCHGTNVGPIGTVRAGNQGVTGGVPFVFSPQASGKQTTLGVSRNAPALKATTTVGLVDGMAVRRLTPRECERLQGFPDDWTRYGEHGEEIADGPRYRMIGNAVAVPVVQWIAKRIMEAKP